MVETYRKRGCGTHRLRKQRQEDRVPGFWELHSKILSQNTQAGDVAQWYNICIASSDPHTNTHHKSRIEREVFTKVKEEREPWKGTCSNYKNRRHRL